jgi:hypothetical protein
VFADNDMAASIPHLLGASRIRFVYDLKAELRDLRDIAPERQYARASRQDFVSGNVIADFEEHRERH